jgi:long-subunit acyl-CoA synthetase (AMP-forming)
MKAGIETKLAAEETPKRKVAHWAIGVGRAKASRELAGRGASLPQTIRHVLADHLVLAKLRHALGLDQVRWAASGAAAIPVDTLEFFAGIGIPVHEVWGMSETSGVSTTNPPGAIKAGTVGRPVDGVEVALLDDGELLCRGPVVMRGYRNDPDKTAETIDADGWVHTGDIATIDVDGYVKIVDRKKELIINEAGKNMSPTNIENALRSASPLIGPVVAVGDAKPYVTALIVLDPEVAASRTTADRSIIGEVTAAVRRANSTLSRVEQIKRFTILDGTWEPGGDELTPTMKLKRKSIAEKYRAQIDALYDAEPGPAVIDLR